MTQMQ